MSGTYPNIGLKSGWIWKSSGIVLDYNVDTASRREERLGLELDGQLCTKFPHSRPQAFIFCQTIWYFCYTIWSLINDGWTASHPNLYSHLMWQIPLSFLFSKSKCSRNIYVIGCFDLLIFTESYLGRRKNGTKQFDIICANVWPKTTISTGCLPYSFLVFKVKCFSGVKSIFLWVIMKEQVSTMNLICINFFLTYFACMSHFLCSLSAFDIIWSLNLIRNMKDFSEAELRRPRGPRCIVEPWDLVGEEIENVFISLSYF